MTNTRGKTPTEAEYDEILRKLDVLLLRHQGQSSVSARAHVNEAAGLELDEVRSGGSAQPSVRADNIPTLTEMVHLTPAMLSPCNDITSLVGQIVDSALKDAGADLDGGVRSTLVRALEARLFGL